MSQAEDQLVRLFEASCDPAWVESATPEEYRERYGEWWNSQTDPAVLEIMDRSHDEVMMDIATGLARHGKSVTIDHGDGRLTRLEGESEE
jgi:hypothetical protein